MSASDRSRPDGRGGPLEETATLEELGEEAVLAALAPLLPTSRTALLGIGDDAAVLTAPDGRFVVTTDMMVHGPDFRLGWSTPADWGWKAAATNLSDVAAMGAVPTALVIALAVPPETPFTTLTGFARGLSDACAALAPGCGVVGGDLSASDTPSVTVTAFGDLEGRQPVRRSGATAGDILAYSGELGLAGAGLRALFEGGFDEDGNADPVRARELWRRHPRPMTAQLRPSPPIGDGPRAADAGAHAMLDVSDGLAKDSRRLARASGVRIVLDPAALGDDPALALEGGEDHGLLAAFPADADLPGGFRRIGAVTPRRGDAPVWIAEEPYRGDGGWDPYASVSTGRSHQTQVSPWSLRRSTR